MKREYSTEIRVRYQETDQMGVVHHGNYLTWFEVGRTEMLRQFGGGYRAVEEQGLLLPVTSVTVNYHKPALYDDLVSIQTELLEYTGIRLVFGYRVTRDQDVLVTGQTQHCLTNKELKPLRLKKHSIELHHQLLQLLGHEDD